MSPLFWLLRLVFTKARLPFLLSCIQQILYAVIPVALAASIGGIVGVLLDQDFSWSSVLPWIIILILAHLLNQTFIFNSFKDYLYQKHLEKALDEPILQKISQFPLQYFEEAKTHDLIARTVNPSQRVQGICEEILHTIGSWLQVLFLVIYIGKMFWWVGPLFILLSLINTKYELSIGNRIQEMNRKLSVPEREQNYLGSLMTGRQSAMELKLFNLGSHLLSRWKQWFQYVHKARLKFDVSMLWPVFLLRLFQGALLFGGFTLLLWQLKNQGSDVALFTSGVVAILSFLEVTDNISWNARNLGEGNAFLEEVQELLNLPEEKEVRGNKAFPQTLKEGIRVENVTFTYPGEREPALKNVSLHIQPGEKIALVGANGSGKSTLVKLLLGLYEPNSGEIFIDGTPMKDIDLIELRKNMSVVFQDFGKYFLTARENIALGDVEKMQNLEAIQEAAKKGGADEFIKQLPNQYDTPFGRLVPNSHEPSGGQWQRLAISRGLVKNAQILFFDEPTSALDPVAEAQLYNQIGELLEGQTAVLVTHRLGSVHTCDRIIVLDEGEVVETGTHEELMAKGGLYAHMYVSQASWYREVGV